jgi:hypothetical protein
MAKLSDAQLAQVAEKILAMGDPAVRGLPKPTATGPPGPTPFKSALDPIGTRADFADAGIGVIDFTRVSPDVWLLNEDKAFRIGSASKIAMVLAAVQLRLEVRRILGLGFISTAKEFDELFRNPKLWKKAETKPPERWIREIADPSGAPLLSKIFDFTKSPVDFIGPDPDSRVKPDGTPDLVEQTAIVDKLPPGTGLREASWAKWTDFTFSEHLWLAGCRSDNVSATACVSAIGTPYIRAVQRCYGLADTAHGMHLFASHGFTGIPPPKKPSEPGPQPPRQLTRAEPIHVEDFWRAKSGAFTDQKSWVPGSAAALTAYMVALMTDKFAGPGADPVAGLITCRTLRNNLADGGPNSIKSFLVDGIKSVPHTTVTRQINKIGILKPSDGAKSPLICEFVYVETKQVPAPPPPRREVMKYAVVAVGLISDPTTAGHNAAEKSIALGKAVHEALLTL